MLTSTDANTRYHIQTHANTRRLPSFKQMTMFGCAIGQPLKKTVDAMSIPGGVLLIHTDEVCCLCIFLVLQLCS